MPRRKIYKLWSPRLAAIDILEGIWDSLDNTERKKLVLQSGLTPAYGLQSVTEIQMLPTHKAYEKFVSLLLARELRLTTPVVNIGNGEFKLNVPIVGNPRMFNGVDTPTPTMLLCIVRGHLVYVLNTSTNSSPDTSLYKSELPDIYKGPTILLGIVRTPQAKPHHFVTKDLVMLDGKWLLHLPAKIRDGFLRHNLSADYRSFNLVLIPSLGF